VLEIARGMSLHLIIPGANELFMSTIFQYNEIVLNAAEILRVMPEWLKKYLALIISHRTPLTWGTVLLDHLSRAMVAFSSVCLTC
jgi:hypothetical protein